MGCAPSHIRAADAAAPRANCFLVFRSFRCPCAQACPRQRSGEPEPAAEVVEVASAHTASAAAAPAAATDPLAGLSPEDADVHRKAQRFARLLVDEIKLYNQAKVAEGRRNKDLYDRLKEDIDKSRGHISKAIWQYCGGQRRIIFSTSCCGVWPRMTSPLWVRISAARFLRRDLGFQSLAVDLESKSRCNQVP